MIKTQLTCEKTQAPSGNFHFDSAGLCDTGTDYVQKSEDGVMSIGSEGQF
jgi:hypothetical protein